MRRPTYVLRSHRWAAVLLTVLAWNMQSQTWSAAVAELRLVDLPEVVDRGTTVMPWSGDSAAVVLWNSLSGRLVFGVCDADRKSWHFRRYVVPTTFRDVRVADLDGDAQPDLLLIDPSGRSIRVASGWIGTDTIRPTYSIPCPVTPSRVIVADLTLDGSPDILLFDENDPGIHLLVNRGGRRWQPGRTIAPDVPVRDAAVAFLNNDEIPDLIAYDWVRSEFHTLYGVGSGRFLDQGVFRCASAVDRLLFSVPRLDEPVRFLTIELARGDITYWAVDEAGELAERARASLGSVIRSSFVVSWNRRGSAEFGLLLTGGRFVRVGASAGASPSLEIVDVGVPERAAWAFSMPRATMGQSDIMVLAPDQLTAVSLRSPDDPATFADSSWWSAGVRPEAVETADLDGDGRSELMVGNRGSRRIDMLWSGRQPERPAGIEVALDAATIGARRLSSSVVRFVTTHPASRAVSIQDLDRGDQSITSATLPVQGTPEWAEEIAGDPAPLVVVHATSPADVGVSMFEPIRPETYLEQSLSLSSPSVLLGASLGDADGDGRPDLMMVYKPDDTSDVAVGIAYGDQEMSMRRRSLLREFPVRSAQRAWIWSVHLDPDTLLDLVVAFPRSHQAVYVLRGQSDSLVGSPMLIDSEVRVPSRSSMRLADLDGDSLLDLVAFVPVRGGVGWWKGDGRGGFSPWKLLISAGDVAGIAVADVTGDGNTDLVITRPSWGAVTIYDAGSVLRRNSSPMVSP